MNDSYLIIIDPGHGGSETGAVANGYVEKDLNLSTSMELKKILEGYFTNILMTRESDIYFDLTARAGWVARKAAAFSGKTICLSVHFNAFNGTARGAETIYSIHSSDALAKAILNKIIELGIPPRRVFSRESQVNPGSDYYAMHRETGSAQTVIIESLFLDNSTDVTFLKKPGFLKELARKQAEGLLQHLNIPQTPMTPPDDKPVDPVRPPEHWASKDYNEIKEFLSQHSISIEDHSGTLDKPATEGLVFRLLNHLRKAGM